MADVIVDVIFEKGPVRALRVVTNVAFAQRYSVECSKCDGVQGVRTEREAVATAKGHLRICVEPVHRALIGLDGKNDVTRAACGATNGTIATKIWDMTCSACREEVRR